MDVFHSGIFAEYYTRPDDSREPSSELTVQRAVKIF